MSSWMWLPNVDVLTKLSSWYSVFFQTVEWPRELNVGKTHTFYFDIRDLTKQSRIKSFISEKIRKWLNLINMTTEILNVGLWIGSRTHIRLCNKCVPHYLCLYVCMCVCMYTCVVFWIERLFYSFHQVLRTVWSSGKFNDPACKHFLHQSQLSKERALGIVHATLQIDPLSALPTLPLGPGQLACRDHLHWLLVDPC